VEMSKHGCARPNRARSALLAMAGLKRLGLVHRARGPLDLEAFLPAPGQGAIALTARTADDVTRDVLAAIADSETGWALTTERAFLAELEGSCRTPIAGHARTENGRVLFQGEVLRPDGSESFPLPPTDYPPIPSVWAERRDAS
jgi:hydroxymethylbilane synthase